MAVRKLVFNEIKLLYMYEHNYKLKPSCPAPVLALCKAYRIVRKTHGQAGWLLTENDLGHFKGIEILIIVVHNNNIRLTFHSNVISDDLAFIHPAAK